MARKKNSDKVKESILDYTQELQLRSLMSLKAYSKGLSDEVDRLISKIESEGTQGYYSASSDILRWSQRVWASCWRLSELKRFEDMVREKDVFMKKEKK